MVIIESKGQQNSDPKNNFTETNYTVPTEINML
jgi:hypothetical protein